MAHPGHPDIESFQLSIARYLNCKFNCVYPYDQHPRDHSDFGTYVRQGMAWFSQPENSIDSLKKDSIEGNNFCKSELGLYHYVGLQTQEDPSVAGSLWKEVANSSQSSDLLKAQASSLLANMYDELATADESDPPEVELWGQAVVWATMSVTSGLTSPTTLKVAQKYSQLRSTLTPANDAFLQPLWAASERRDREMEEKRATQAERVQKAPHKYRCANPDCPIECFRRGPLKKCAGPCPEAYKPHYCGEACQKAHWKRHKPACKAGALPTDEPADESTSGGTNVSDRPPKRHIRVEISRIDGEEEEDIRFRGSKGTFVAKAKHGDGSSTLFSSSTMNSEMLRDLVQQIEEKEI